MFYDEFHRVSTSAGEEIAVGCDEEWPAVSLAFWEHGHQGFAGGNWWWRFKRAWHCFWRGHDYLDMVLLDSKMSFELALALTIAAKKVASAEQAQGVSSCSSIVEAVRKTAKELQRELQEAMAQAGVSQR